ncbi:FIG01122115: hypothetical protein [Alloactinosynnema sp. L-07]|uniref:DUF3710 domain-containing protein n=1 Tax=Alloactinosynnema sp. L-07 TaxID=1653480 RepID=UPI00065EF4E9|nr:DUF3710 domain-containing protein [Alloactinosynnema sp. L-07]CRK55837.1 FIG01122115: hypothetical protein [Alloactinosynnema sp. L-07]
MALFGKRKRKDEEPRVEEVESPDFDELDDVDQVDRADGPYDESEAPDDESPRLDLGSLRIPVPDGAQLQVEMDPAGPVRAVHVLTPIGQLTLNAYAAPRSGGLWREVCGELAEQLRTDGASVRSQTGEWGQELSASLNEVALRFVGVDGPRWMLRGVVAGPPELADTSTEALRAMLRNTIVVRGTQPMPVRTPLQIDLPQAIAEHIAQADQQQA